GGVDVEADDLRAAGVDGLLRFVCGILNLALDEALFDGAERASRAIERRNQRVGLPLDLRRAPLDFPRAADRIDRVGDAGFGRDDLLRAQGDPRRLFRWQGQR